MRPIIQGITNLGIQLIEVMTFLREVEDDIIILMFTLEHPYYILEVATVLGL